MTEEQLPEQPESGSPPGVPPAAPAPARRRGGCLGRFFSAILVIVITTFLALVAGASALLWFGYTPDTPRQLGAAQIQLATVQAQGDALQAQNSALQTEIAAQSQRYGTDHETLSEISNQLANIADLRNALRDERQQSASQNATLVAEARDSRNAVAIFATIEADRAVLLADLDRRSARVERFLQRLSDISSDTALDLAATQAPVLPTSPPAQTTISELSPTPTQVPTSAPTATSASTSTSVATEPPTPTARRQSPTALSELSPTPTLGR
ncbi:MAG: hypothetical protein ABIV47_23195 [Roseiflexaceae bacterium]